MSTRYVHQSAGTDDMDSAYGGSAPIKVDSDDGLLKWKDSDGNVRESAYAGGPAPVESFAADGAITTTSGLKKLTKAGVGAYTLAAPTAAEEGNLITLHSTTDNAHVVTATGLINDGVTGGAKDTITFAAFAGASATLRAVGLFWSVEALNATTVA